MIIREQSEYLTTRRTERGKLYYGIAGSRQNKWTGAMDKAQNIMLKKIVKVFIYRYIHTYTYLCTHRYVYIVYVRDRSCSYKICVSMKIMCIRKPECIYGREEQ